MRMDRKESVRVARSERVRQKGKAEGRGERKES